MEKAKFKRKVIEQCRQILESKIRHLREMMDIEQETANEHVGAMESRYDTFKEEAQDRKSALAKQVSVTQSILSDLLDIKCNSTENVKYGSLILINDNMGFFMFTNFTDEDLIIDEIKIKAISVMSPLGKTFINKRLNDVVTFKNIDYRIIQLV